MTVDNGALLRWSTEEFSIQKYILAQDDFSLLCWRFLQEQCGTEAGFSLADIFARSDRI